MHLYDDDDPSKFCGVQGRLSDNDVIKFQNLPLLDRDVNWNHQELTCGLPKDHGIEQHIQILASQGFETPVLWWASWLDMDGLRDEAATFTGPICDAPYRPPGQADLGLTCLLLSGHTTPDDKRHVLA